MRILMFQACCAFLLALMVAELRKNDIPEALASISGTFFGVFYVGWLLSHAIPLRQFYDTMLSRYDAADLVTLELAPEAGIFFFVLTLTVVVNCDVGAYFAGRAYGRRLGPRASYRRGRQGHRQPWWWSGR
jgi:CDP-diglyceride synthetase